MIHTSDLGRTAERARREAAAHAERAEHARVEPGERAPRLQDVRGGGHEVSAVGHQHRVVGELLLQLEEEAASGPPARRSSSPWRGSPRRARPRAPCTRRGRGSSVGLRAPRSRASRTRNSAAVICTGTSGRRFLRSSSAERLAAMTFVLRPKPSRTSCGSRRGSRTPPPRRRPSAPCRARGGTASALSRPSSPRAMPPSQVGRPSVSIAWAIGAGVAAVHHRLAADHQGGPLGLAREQLGRLVDAHCRPAGAASRSGSAPARSYVRHVELPVEVALEVHAERLLAERLGVRRAALLQVPLAARSTRGRARRPAPRRRRGRARPRWPP